MNIYVNFKIRYNHNEEGLLNLSHSFIFLKLDFPLYVQFINKI